MKTTESALFASKPLRRVLSAFAAFSVLMTSMPLSVCALDAANVTSSTGIGSVTTVGSTTTVTQPGQVGIINWSTFDMAAGETADFDQAMGMGAVTLNRITADANGTQIAGQINAAGGVWVVDPNGVFIQNGASINVGAAFVAAAMNISDTDFNNYVTGSDTAMRFSGTAGAVENRGSITAGTRAVLLGGAVYNDGTINAAQAVLAAAGTSIVLDEVGGGTITLTLADDASADLQLGGSFSGDVAAAVKGQDIAQDTAGAVDIAGTVGLVAEGGAITLGNAANDFQGGVTAHAGLSLTLADANAINLADVDTENGAITVTAGGQITATDVRSQTDNDANDISLTGVGIEVGTVAAGTGAAADVALDAGTGAITDIQADTVTQSGSGFAQNASRTVNIVADQLGMAADGSIGAAGNPLDITVNTVAAASANGSVYLYESDALTVGTVGALSGVTAGQHAKVETISGTLTVGQAVTATAGDLLLAANGAGSDVTLNAAAEATAGSVTVLAYDAIGQNAGITAGGTIDVQATGNIVMALGATSASGGADGDNIRYSSVFGGIKLGHLDAGDGVVAVDAFYDILGAGDAVNVTAAGAQFRTLFGDIGEPAGVGSGPLRTAADTLAAYSGGSQFFYQVAAGGDVTVDTVGAADNTSFVNRVGLDSSSTEVTITALSDLQSEDGKVMLATGAGSITVNDGDPQAQGTGMAGRGVSAAGDVLLDAWRYNNDAAGDITLNAAVVSEAGSVSVLANRNIAQNVTATSQGDIIVVSGDGTIDLEAFEGSVIMDAGTLARTDGGHIRYAADQDMALGFLDARTQEARDAAADGIDNDGDTLTDAADMDELNWNRGSEWGLAEVLVGDGSLSDSNGTDVNIAARGTLLRVGAGGIGEAEGTGGGPLDLQVGTLAAYSLDDQYFLQVAAGGDITVDTVGALTDTMNWVKLDSTREAYAFGRLSDLEATAGSVALRVENGTLTVNDGDVTVQNSGMTGLGVKAAGNVLLEAQNDGNTADLVLNAGVSAENDLSVLADDDLLQNADLVAGGTIDAEAFGGSVTMADGTIAQTTGGDIRYAAAGDVTLDTLDARTAADRAGGTLADQANWGDVQVSAGGSILDAHGDTVGHDAEGFATQTGDARAVNVYADGAALTATAGSIGQAGNPLDTEVFALAAAAGGSAYLYESTDVTVDNVAFAGVNRVGLDSSVTAETGKGDLSDLRAGVNAKLETVNGTLTVNEGDVNPADSGGGVSAVSGDVLLAANGTGSDVILNAGIVETGASATVLARDSVEQNEVIDIGYSIGDGTIDVQAFDGSITMSDGAWSWSGNWVGDNIRYAAGQDVTLGYLRAGAGSVSVQAGRDILDARGDTVGVDPVTGFATQTGLSRTENILAAEARLEAGGTIGAAGNPLDTAVDVLAVKAGTGSAYIYESDGVAIGTVAAVTVDRIGLDSTATPWADAAALSGATAGQNVKLETIDGTLTVGQEVTATAGDALLAANGDDADVEVDAAVTASAGDVTVLASDGISQAAAGDITAGGTIGVEAFDGAIDMEDGAESRTSGGNIRYAAAGDVTLGTLDARTAADRAGDTLADQANWGDVQVASGSGSILDAHADTVEHGAEGFASQTGAGRTENIFASAAQLTAGHDIGQAGTFGADGHTVVTPGNPLDIEVGTLAASAGGSAYLYESTDVTVGSVVFGGVNRMGLDSSVTPAIGANDLSGIEALTGHMKLETIAGSITVNAAVLTDNDGAEGDILLAANGTGSDVVLNAYVSADRHVTVLARNSVIQHDDLDAGWGMFGGTIDVEAFEGDIAMDDGTYAWSGTGSGDHIRYAAAGDVTLGRLDAGNGMVQVVAGRDILDAHADTVEHDAEGFALQTGADRTENIIASAAQLTAGRDIGQAGTFGADGHTVVTPGNPLDIEVGTLAVEAGGSAYLYESTGVTVDVVGKPDDPLTTLADERDFVNRIGLDSSVTPFYIDPMSDLRAVVGPVKLETVDGTITVNEGRFHPDTGIENPYNLSSGVEAGGDVLLAANGAGSDVILNAAVEAGRHVTVLARDGVEQNVVLNPDGSLQSKGDITAGGMIDVQAYGGSIVMRDAATDGIDNDGDGFVDQDDSDETDRAISQTMGRNILYSAAGDVTLTTLDARTAVDRAGDTLADQASWGDVQVAAGGDILDAHKDRMDHENTGILSVGVRVVNVFADGLQLVAGGTAGEAGTFGLDGHTTITTGNPLDIEVATLAATADGGMYLFESTDVTVDTVVFAGVDRAGLDSSVTPGTGLLDMSDLASSAGSVKLAVDNGTIAVKDGDAAAQAAGMEGIGLRAANDILLDAYNDGNRSDVVLDADLVAGGSVTILTDDDVVQRADIMTGGTIEVESFEGSIVMADGTAATTAGGNIRFVADDDVTLGLLDAGNGMVQVIADDGSILDARGDTVGHDPLNPAFAVQTGDARTANINASAAQLDAGGNIGAAGNPLDIEVDTVTAFADGSAYLYETDGITVGSVAFSGVNRVGLDSSLRPGVGAGTWSGIDTFGHAKLETRDGTLTVASGAMTAGQDVLLAANGAGSDVVLNDDVLAGGSVTVLARHGVTQGASIAAVDTIDVEAFTGDITMQPSSPSTSTGGANIRYAAAGDVVLDRLDAGVGMVRVEAGGDITDGNAAAKNVVASAVQLAAGGSVGGPGAAAIDTQVGTLAARASGGSVYVSEADALTLGTMGVIGVNRIGLDSSATPVAGAALSGVAAAQNVKVENGVDAAGSLTVASAVTATAGDALLQAFNGDAAVNASVTSGGDASVLASQGVAQSAGGDITAGGTIDVEAFGGPVDLAEGALARTTAGGNIRYAATGDVVLNGVLDAGTGDVAVEAGGDITDNGNDVTVSANGFANGNDDVNIFARQVSLRAVGDVGNTGAGTSGTRPFNPITVVADEVAAQGANVAVYGKEDLTIGSVGDITVTRVLLNDAAMDVTSAGLSGINAGCGNVNLMADHSVIDGNDAGADIAAGSLVVSAGHIIGAGDDGNSIDALEISLCGGSAPADVWINNVAGGGDGFVYAFLDTVGGIDDPVAAAAKGSGALIFINGQYVGGDPTFVQFFAAAEAFPAETPELKSRQGVFGDPFFLHDQMDINEPVALGLIDFILAEKATITGDPEIPAEAYIEILSGGLSPSSAIWFGKKADDDKSQTEKKSPEKKEQAEASKAEPVQISALH